MSLDHADATEEPGNLNNHAFQELVVPDSFLADQSSIIAPWDTNHFDQRNRRSSSTSTGSSSSASSGSSSGSSSSGSSGSSSGGSSSGSSGSGSGSSGESDSDDSISSESTHTSTIEPTRLPSPGPAPPIIPVSDSSNIRENVSTDDEYDPTNDDLNDMVVSINDAFNDASHHENPNQLNNAHWNTTNTSFTDISPREEEIIDGDEDETEYETEDEDEDEDFFSLDRRQQRSYVDDEGNFRLAAASSMDNYNEGNLSEDDMNRAFFLEGDYQEFTIDAEEREIIRRQAEANAAISDDPSDDELAGISQTTRDMVNSIFLVEPEQRSSGQTLQNGATALDAGQPPAPGDMEDRMSADEENIPPNN